MNVYIISDLHLGHEKIALLRGFKSAEEQDEVIISNWNKIVNKRDKIIIPGDITMEKAEPLRNLLKMNGFKHVIPGNHDIKGMRQLLDFSQKVTGPFKYKKKIWITHFPIHPLELHGKMNAHGHVHQKSIEDEMYFNVSADVLEYRPLDIRVILDKYDLIMAERKK
jgi:calcineurin-like phosphoesterase family protein